MRFGKKLALLGMGLIFTAAVSARADMVDRTVANVNGHIILYSEVQEQEKLMEKVIPQMAKDLEDPVKKKAIESDILEQLIRQKLAEEEVKRLKIYVANGEIESRIQEIIHENHATEAQFEAMLKQNGQTLDKFKETIRKDIERTRLMERAFKNKIVITDEQVDAYMKEGSGKSSSVLQQVRLGIIFLPVNGKVKSDEVEKTGREIIQKIKSGTDFRKMAVQYSKGPAASEGGDIGYMGYDELAPYIAQAVKDLKNGEITGLVTGPGGYYILKVFDVRREVKEKTASEKREKVRMELYNKEVNRKFEEWVRDLESRAFIQRSL